MHSSLAERFRGADLSRVADRARRTLGDDVMILHTRTVRDGGVLLVVEVINEMRDGWRCRRRSFGCDSRPDWELRSPLTLART